MRIDKFTINEDLVKQIRAAKDKTWVEPNTAELKAKLDKRNVLRTVRPN